MNTQPPQQAWQQQLWQKLKRIEHIWLVLVLALLSAASYQWRWTESLDLLIFDSAQRLSGIDVPADILIVAIDERSMLKLGRWPWSREYHAELLNRLTETGAKAVAFDVIFAEPDSSNPEHDERFAEAMFNHGNVVLPVYMERTHRHGQILEVPPIQTLYEQAAGVGHVHVEFDQDGVCRSVFLKEGLGSAYWPHLTVALNQALGSDSNPLPGLIVNQSSSADASMMIVRNHHNLIPASKEDSVFNTVSYIDVLEKKIPARLLKDKIVFVGATATGIGDVIVTPVGVIPGVELNAMIFEALRHDAFIQPVASIIGVLITILVTSLVTFYFGRLSPRILLLATMSSIVLIILSSVMVLLVQRYWLPPTSILLAVLLFYPLWSWRRLEMALSYLKAELQRATDKSSSQVSYLDRIIAGLEYYSKVLPLHAWRLVKETEGQIRAGGDRASLLDATKTVESFSLAQQQYRLELDWKTDSVPEAAMTAYRQRLQQLVQMPDVNLLQQKTIKAELISQTIKELAAAKKRANESRNLVYQSLAQLQEGVIIADIAGQIIFVNDQAQNYVYDEQIAEPDLLTLLKSIQISGGASWPTILRDLIINDEGFTFEAVAQKTACDLLCKGSLLSLIDSNDTVIISLADISPVKEVERARSEALHFLSHDLRSPMVSVLAIIERAKIDQPALQGDKLLSGIEGYVKKNLSYAEGFLQLAKAENIVASNFDICDMHVILDNAVAQIMPLAKLKQMKLNSERTQHDAWVIGDGELLERAIINLLSNAVKYSDPASAVIVTLAQQQSEVVVKVIDAGYGIPADQLDSVFDRFKRGDQKNSEAGIGLGLYFVKVVAQRHKGDVSVESIPTQGTTFTLRLPYHPLEEI